MPLVAQLALDRNGAAAPFASELAYEQASVATAYGSCTEPSNVQAGGKSCPIRFQCSGRGFYRPDPSCLGAVEQQQAQLRADRAVARAGDEERARLKRRLRRDLGDQVVAHRRRDGDPPRTAFGRRRLHGRCRERRSSRS